jgi:hypothetical protein
LLRVAGLLPCVGCCGGCDCCNCGCCGDGVAAAGSFLRPKRPPNVLEILLVSPSAAAAETGSVVTFCGTCVAVPCFGSVAACVVTCVSRPGLVCVPKAGVAAGARPTLASPVAAAIPPDEVGRPSLLLLLLRACCGCGCCCFGGSSATCAGSWWVGSGAVALGSGVGGGGGDGVRGVTVVDGWCTVVVVVVEVAWLPEFDADSIHSSTSARACPASQSK